MGTTTTSAKFRYTETLHAHDERWQLVLRIASSAQFRRASRLREFLLYVCDKALQGEVESLTEQQIAHAVFDRGKDYSPAEDNVVRAHARQVRVKLAEYFAECGPNEPLYLEIPKGTYVPTFTARPEPERIELQPVGLPPVAVGAGTNSSKHSFNLWLALTLGLVVTASIAVYLFAENWELRRTVDRLNSAELLTPPLSWVFDDKAPTTIVVADSSFGLLQDLQGRTATLEDYLNLSFAPPIDPSGSQVLRSLEQRLGTRQFTSFADLMLSHRLLQIGMRYRDRISVRSARDLRMRDLSYGNFVFLGSSYSNPWVSLFSKRRNFSVSLDAASRRGIVSNRAPKPGEEPVYVMKGEDGLAGPTYGVMAFLPADAETGNVLIIEGINMEGTEAAGRYLTNVKELEELHEVLGLQNVHGTKTPFEVLFGTKVMGGATRDTKIVAVRKGKYL